VALQGGLDGGDERGALLVGLALSQPCLLGVDQLAIDGDLEVARGAGVLLTRKADLRVVELLAEEHLKSVVVPLGR
jgi:hypothetical protein